MINYDDFSKVEVKVGKILSAEKIPDTDKLLKLSVDFGVIPTPVVPAAAVPLVAVENIINVGESAPVAPVVIIAPVEVRDIRQIVSGIATYFPDTTVLVGKKCMFVTNLEPRKIKGFDSNGMLFAVSTKDGKFSLLEPGGDIPEGTRAY